MSSVSSAQIYKCLASNGHVSFSQYPCENQKNQESHEKQAFRQNSLQPPHQSLRQPSVSTTIDGTNIPVFSKAQVTSNKKVDSAKPGLGIHYYFYQVTTSLAKVVKFYQASGVINSCHFVTDNAAYKCSLKKNKTISAGYVMVAPIKTGGTAVYIDYFYFKAS
nr:DUF4124 domain-containing protein [Saccharobesus litoralis]